jgi:type II secretory pathway component PulF
MQFQYKATDKKGKQVQGTVSASNLKEAERFIEDKDLSVLTVKPLKKSTSSLFSRGFPLREKISLCRYMGLIINSGLSIGEGLDMLASGTTNKLSRQIIEDVAASTRRGTSLFESFSKYEKYFGAVFLTIVKTGETSGTLSESFSYLANQFEQEKEIRQKVFGALLYPLIIIGLMCAVGILMFTFVLPQLANVFKTMNVKIPTLTKIMFSASLALKAHTVPFLGGVALAVVLFILFIKSPPGHSFIMWVFVRMPVIKKIVQEYNLVRFSQSLSALLKSGVPVTEAVELSTKSLSFVDVKVLSATFTKNLTKGVSLAECFASAKLFPPLVLQLISIGEKTGSLEHTLADLSAFYENEIENTLKNLTTILEPILMVIVGVGVGAMVISIISPIYGLIGQLQAGL